MKKLFWILSVCFVAVIFLLVGCAPATVEQPAEEEAEENVENPVALSTPPTPFSVPDNCPQYPADFQIARVPDPLSGQNPVYPLDDLPMPAVGDCFTDPTFGTVLQRVTVTDGMNGRHEYSRVDPYNADQSLILLVDDEGGYRVYRTDSLPYNQPDNQVFYINQTEPRWDPADPLLLWAFQDFSIVQINLRTGEVNTIKDFSQDATIGPLIAFGTTYRITMMDEGESSLDKRFWAFSLQGNDQVDYTHQYLFTYDLQTDSVLGVYPSDGSTLPETGVIELDWVGISPLGNWVLIGSMDSNTGNIVGLTMASLDLTTFHRIDYTTSHADVGLDVNGNEVVVMQSYNTDTIDMIPLSLDSQPILESGGSETGTGRIPLIRLYYASDSTYGLSSGVHISCNTPGYCFISTTIPSSMPAANWLDRSLLLVRLDSDDPAVYYLAKLHNTISEEPRVYWDETHGSISADGSLLVWADNWGLNVGTDQVFMMLLIMPENWQELTSH